MVTHDPGCFLCPGNRRAAGTVNPDYRSTFVFDNDYPALAPGQTSELGSGPLIRAETVAGTCRVLCFSPRHDLSLSMMDSAPLVEVVDMWAEQWEDLSVRYPSVQVFENRGEAMGASSPHPHGQVWAASTVPHELRLEDERQRAYKEEHGTTLLGDYLDYELSVGERVVLANEAWVALSPYWAVWPYETLLVCRTETARLPEVDPTGRRQLALALKELLSLYDALFDQPFPYSMGWHGAPGGADPRHWALHAHFYPPMLNPDRRKFMVGYEMLAEPQRDISPEEAASQLREAGGRIIRDPSITG
jgi:UDPglucose--hexose-1-phosphate uridylyltransferase